MVNGLESVGRGFSRARQENLMATIKVRQNGPYLVEGEDVTVVDWNGNAYEIPKRPFALCRCGGSTNKPFCDGTHSRTGFQAAEAAVPGSGDKPA
jgi:CDGSH-type Zn-finger protein